MRTTLILKLLILLSASVLFPACATESVDDGKMQVVATTSVLGDVVNRAFGAEVAVVTIMPAGADPHEFEPSAQQVAEIQSADLVVANGLGLEEGLEDVLAAVAVDSLFEVGSHVETLSLEASGDVDSHDDVDSHGDLDPHVWLDPTRVVVALDELADQLATIDSSVDWRSVASEYRSELVGTDEWIVDRLAAIPSADRILVTGHDAFGYYADRYGFEVVATILPGATTMVEPSASGFADVVAIVEASGAPAVFTDIGENQALAEQLVQQLDRDLLVVPLYSGTFSGDGIGPNDYVSMLRWNTEQIAVAFEQ